MAPHTPLPPWLAAIHHDLVEPRRQAIARHPFMEQMLAGRAERRDAGVFFAGLLWHLLDFGKHVAHLMDKRPAIVGQLLTDRSEDKDGDTDILARIVGAFGQDAALIEKTPWRFSPHRVWIHHDALLRSAVYSTDYPWQVGTAALNVGIESLVPDMIEPLFRASIRNYGVTSTQAQWLASRSGEAERQHGENGYLLLTRYVDSEDLVLQDQCRFFVEALSDSMAYGLLESGLKG